MDIGTDSVGYAVTDTDYKLVKFKGEHMWGVTTFDEAQSAEDRRNYRTSRRRTDRRQWRLKLLEGIFAKEIARVDDRFFIRRYKSGLNRSETGDDRYLVFNEEKFNDKKRFFIRL